MTILGITNRTENWKTARHFYPFFGQEASVCLAKKLGEPSETKPGEVRLELYWKGMRDHLHEIGATRASDDNDYAESYTRLFGDLRRKIEGFNKFRELNDCNYDVSTKERRDQLRDNLINTEIDIVLESPNCLYIGEAKHEMSFGADGSLVLVHQLIRQYVMARILLDRLGCKKDVIPFVVGDDAKGLKKSQQVKFMIYQGWMNEENVLKWGKVKKLACDS